MRIGRNLRVKKKHILDLIARIIGKTAWGCIDDTDKYYERCEIDSSRLEWIQKREKFDFQNNKDIPRHVIWGQFAVFLDNILFRTEENVQIIRHFKCGRICRDIRCYY